jgi:hypothetical protein
VKSNPTPNESFRCAICPRGEKIAAQQKGRAPVVQFQHSHPIEAGTLRMLELKDHWQNHELQWSFGFDVRFARLRRH